MSECTHNCSSCSKDCSDRKDFKEKQNELSNIKKVIGIVSGKGGVGKSLITALLSVLTKRKGKKVAVLDADITGPSIPKLFGLNKRAEAMDDKYLLPVITKTGIEVMSINFFKALIFGTAFLEQSIIIPKLFVSIFYSYL